MKDIIAGTLIVVGLMIMAGSAGDCDGHCMEQANSLAEMMIYAMIGLAMSGVGAITLAHGRV